MEEGGVRVCEPCGSASRAGAARVGVAHVGVARGPRDSTPAPPTRVLRARASAGPSGTGRP